MKNSIRGILLSFLAIIFAVSIMAFGFSLNTRASADSTDYSKAENWFGLFKGVTKVEDKGNNSYDFTIGDALQGVVWFKEDALNYLVDQGYDAVRITYYGKSGADINLAIKKGDGSFVWTNYNGAQSQDFDITNGAFSIYSNYAVKEGIDGFNLTFEAIDYDKVEDWFTADVTCEKVADSENSFDFTTDDSRKQVLHFHKEALAYLTEQGYDIIRITYYGKSGADINLAIAKDNKLTGWTNYNGAQSQDFDITGGGSLIIQANYAVKDGIDGFNLTFEAIDYEAPEELFSVYDGNVTLEKVSKNSFNFTRASDGGVLSFKANSLTRLVNKGYDLIRVTYLEENASSSTNMIIYKGGEAWNSTISEWTHGSAKVRDFDITQGAFSIYLAKSTNVTTFNFAFTLIDKDVSVVTYKIDGIEKAVEEITWSAENLTAKMPAKEVDNAEIIGYEYNGSFYPDLSAVYNAVTESYFVEVNAVTLQLETVDGASIRMVETAGLRFSSVVGKSERITSYGMILTIRKNVDKDAATGAVGLESFTKEGLTNANLKYLEINSKDSGFKSYDEDGNTCFNIVLTDIVDSHLSWEYIARTYVEVLYDNGETHLVYSSVDFANNARSATTVADAAIASGNLTETQTSYIKDNYYSKKA